MGYYINPSDKSKEDFLKEKGTPVPAQQIREFAFTDDRLPVCLVNNGGFTAAGIAYDPGERDVFMYPDGRPKRWFLVSKADLKPWYSKG